MKKFYVIVALILLTGLSACHAKDDPVLSGIIFERSHGSMWGNQFYIDINASQIKQLSYVSKDTLELDTHRSIPILPEQWQALEDAVMLLDLQEDKTAWKDSLFGSHKADGGEYRKLTLLWRNGNDEKEIHYLWTQSQQAEILESLLEQLAETVK